MTIVVKWKSGKTVKKPEVGIRSIPAFTPPPNTPLNIMTHGWGRVLMRLGMSCCLVGVMKLPARDGVTPMML